MRPGLRQVADANGTASALIAAGNAARIQAPLPDEQAFTILDHQETRCESFGTHPLAPRYWDIIDQ